MSRRGPAAVAALAVAASVLAGCAYVDMGGAAQGCLAAEAFAARPAADAEGLAADFGALASALPGSLDAPAQRVSRWLDAGMPSAGLDEAMTAFVQVQTWVADECAVYLALDAGALAGDGVGLSDADVFVGESADAIAVSIGGAGDEATALVLCAQALAEYADGRALTVVVTDPFGVVLAESTGEGCTAAG